MGSAEAQVFIFFWRGEDFSRSSLGQGWLELPIFDCRLPIGKLVWQLPPLSAGIADFRLPIVD
jgi:hypothetical protein